MVEIKIKTDRTMEIDGNWCDTKVTVINCGRVDEPPELGVQIVTDGSRNIFLLEELRAITAFAEEEAVRIKAEWDAGNG